MAITTDFNPARRWPTRTIEQVLILKLRFVCRADRQEPWCAILRHQCVRRAHASGLDQYFRFGA